MLPLFNNGGFTMTLKEFQRLWAKEIKRIENAISRLQKRGYTVDYEKPKTPKGIAPKQLEELKSETTPQKLLKRAEYKDPTTGETLSGYKGRERERKKAAEKGKRTRKKRKYLESKKPLASKELAIATNLRAFLSKWSTERPDLQSYGNPHFRDVLGYKREKATELLSLYNAKEIQDPDNFYRRLEMSAEELNSLMEEYNRASSQESTDVCAVEIATIINGESLSFEESASLTEANDYFDSYVS